MPGITITDLIADLKHREDAEREKNAKPVYFTTDETVANELCAALSPSGRVAREVTEMMRTRWLRRNGLSA